jgi:hypothetical protein
LTPGVNLTKLLSFLVTDEDANKLDRWFPEIFEAKARSLTWMGTPERCSAFRHCWSNIAELLRVLAMIKYYSNSEKKMLFNIDSGCLCY